MADGESRSIMRALPAMALAILVLRELSRLPDRFHPLANLGSEPLEGNTLREQYREVTAFLRHYSGLRFAAFTVYLAVQAGLAAVARDVSTQRVVADLAWNGVGFGLLLVALLVTWVFCLTERTLAHSIIYFEMAAHEIEPKLGYSVLTRRPIEQGLNLVPMSLRILIVQVGLALLWVAWALWPFVGLLHATPLLPVPLATPVIGP